MMLNGFQEDFNTYQERNLRYSQIVPISMFEERTQVLIYQRKLYLF
jgi:hypothetical protein